MKIGAAKLSCEEVAWIWAYQEALRWLDIFDAESIASAKNRWARKTWESFMTKYGLRRGKFHPVVLEKTNQVWDALAPILSPPLPKDCMTDELNFRWEQAVQLVGKLLPPRQDGSPPELWSMTSKLLWFFQPDHMTMYDDFAHKGLRQHVAGRRLRRSEFLARFHEFFETNNNSIRLAETFSNRVYPYHRRVADFRLWLKGKPNNEEEAILKAFRMSLIHAPPSKRQ